MHVAFLTPRFFPCRGGYENYVLSLARALVSEGNRISVFTTTALDLEAFWVAGHHTLPMGRTAFDGIDISRYPIIYERSYRYPRRLLALLPNWKLKARFARPAFFVRGLRNELHRARPDIIHVGPLPYNSLMFDGIAEARRLNVPVLATPCTHFGEDTNSEISRQYVQDFQVNLLNCCDKVLTLTAIEAARLQDRGVRANKLLVSGAGIDVVDVSGGDQGHVRSKYSLGEDPIVLHLGMRAPDKGSVCVVEAMKIVWQRHPSARLVLAGPSLSAFDLYLSTASVGCERLLTLGPVSDAEKRDWLAAATVVVQPSRVESLGLILLEAWANEKPVIAADTAVSRELVAHGRDGLLVPFGNNSRLAHAITQLLQDSSSRRAMGIRGREKLMRCLGDNWLAKTLPLFSTRKPYTFTM